MQPLPKSRVKVTINDKKLRQFTKGLKVNYSARVGILGDSNQREDGEFGNADLGFIHEFGSITKNIPARSFLRFPIQFKTKEIVKKIMILKSSIAKAMAEGNLKRFFEVLGLQAEVAIQEAFETRGFGQWKANDPKTIKRKGSDSPLIDTGELRRAITSEVVKKK